MEELLPEITCEDNIMIIDNGLRQAMKMNNLIKECSSYCTVFHT
uniref:Uncharacterized protein n=1 Tax=Arundo donax TaxID=35708 RepID=A0A0A8Z142_ARUDO